MGGNAEELRIMVNFFMAAILEHSNMQVMHICPLLASYEHLRKKK